MSRHSARSRQLRRRPSRTVPATVVALVILALGVLTAIASTSRLVSGSWPATVSSAAAAVAPLAWASTAVLASGAVVALLGLVLLVAGVKLGSSRTATLTAGGVGDAVGGTEFVISTRSLARMAAARADQVDGVDKVSASASARRVELQVTTTSEHVDEIRRQVTEGVTERLAATGVQPVPRVRATVRTKGI